MRSHYVLFIAKEGEKRHKHCFALVLAFDGYSWNVTSENSHVVLAKKQNNHFLNRVSLTREIKNRNNGFGHYPLWWGLDCVFKMLKIDKIFKISKSEMSQVKELIVTKIF